ncbi:MAG: P-loop NTPase [Myxococcota bacterium]
MSAEGQGRIIAVGGGKGGIGKSLCSASLSIALARLGNRVVVVDADLGGANLHTCLGVLPPLVTLSDFVNRRVEQLEDVLVRTPMEGVSMVAGAMDMLDSANPTHQQKQRLIRHLLRLQADYVILDLGAGSSFNILDFFLLAEHGILVMVPEPTSVENAYRFLKSAYLRRFRTVEKVYDIKHLIDEAMEQRNERGIRTPLDLVNAIKATDAEAGSALEQEMAKMRVRLLVNQVREPADAKVGDQIRMACQRYFGVNLDYLGSIPHDEAVWRAVRAKQPLLQHSPGSPAAQAFFPIAQRIMALDRASIQAA